MPRQNRKNKQNGSRTKTKPGQNYRVYCPECPPESGGAQHPQMNVHMIVDGTNPPIFAVCKNGHKVRVVRTPL